MKKYLPTLLVGLLALPLTAYAGSEEFYTPIPANGSVKGYIDVDDSADGGYKDVDVRNTASPSIRYNGVGGQFQGYFSTVANAVLEDKNPTSLFFRFFCIDLYQTASDNPTAYTASQYSNSNMQKLYDVAYPSEKLGDFYNGTSTTDFGTFAGNGNSYSKQEYSAAFQLALWELVYEKNTLHSLNSGNFRNALLDSNAHAIANNWLSQVDDYTGSGYKKWQLYGFTSGDTQDFLSARYDVPEPSSMLLAGLGLAGLVMTSRRRRNNKA